MTCVVNEVIQITVVQGSIERIIAQHGKDFFDHVLRSEESCEDIVATSAWRIRCGPAGEELAGLALRRNRWIRKTYSGMMADSAL